MKSWPGSVGGMRLAREDDLHRAVGVVEQPRQPLGIAEEQRRALVGGEAAGEADGQRVGVEQRMRRARSQSAPRPDASRWRASRVARVGDQIAL